MPWFRKRIDRVMAIHDLTEAMVRAEQPIPTGSLIYTPAGRKSHYKAALTEGAMCPDLANWPGPWMGTGSSEERERAASLPLCPRCEIAASTSREIAS
jgi:hypothetical protein